MERFRQPASGGSSLLLVVMLMLILAITLRALVRVGSVGSQRALRYHQEAAASQVLEAAVRDAMFRLERDPGWNEGFRDKPVAELPEGRYSIVFYRGGPAVEAFDSVNNLTGQAAVDGPRGAGTVPAASVLLRVTARFGGAERRAVDPMPPSSTRSFLGRKLDQVARTFCDTDRGDNPYNPPGVSSGDVLANWERGDATLAGVFDAALNVDPSPQLEAEIYNYVRLLDWDGLGTSYFQGLVYTHGYLYAENEVTVIGSVQAEDDGSQPGETLDGTQVFPGDILLRKGVHLVLNKEYARAGGGQSLRLGVASWVAL